MDFSGYPIFRQSYLSKIGASQASLDLYRRGPVELHFNIPGPRCDFSIPTSHKLGEIPYNTGLFTENYQNHWVFICFYMFLYVSWSQTKSIVAMVIPESHNDNPFSWYTTPVDGLMTIPPKARNNWITGGFSPATPLKNMSSSD